MDRPIVIYGKNGQVASALAAELKENAAIFASTEFDFSEIKNIHSALKEINAKAIINATAYTDVNKAEVEEDLAYKANALIPRALAQYALEKDIPLVHYSTDYVFDGKGEEAQPEETKTAPLNAYGRTKLAGEKEIKKIGGKYLIFRTSWVYDHKGKNFLNTMLKLGTEREQLSVVADQFGAPTYAPHLANATLEILDSSLSHWERAGVRVTNETFPRGIYHLCNSGFTSWHGFAEEIFRQARKRGIELKVIDVKPISSNDFPTPAKRPQNSRLDCSLASEKFGVTMPNWKEGVEECFLTLKHGSVHNR